MLPRITRPLSFSSQQIRCGEAIDLIFFTEARQRTCGTRYRVETLVSFSSLFHFREYIFYIYKDVILLEIIFEQRRGRRVDQENQCTPRHRFVKHPFRKGTVFPVCRNGTFSGCSCNGFCSFQKHWRGQVCVGDLAQESQLQFLLAFAGELGNPRAIFLIFLHVVGFVVDDDFYGATCYARTYMDTCYEPPQLFYYATVSTDFFCVSKLRSVLWTDYYASTKFHRGCCGRRTSIGIGW